MRDKCNMQLSFGALWDSPDAYTTHRDGNACRLRCPEPLRLSGSIDGGQIVLRCKRSPAEPSLCLLPLPRQLPVCPYPSSSRSGVWVCGFFSPLHKGQNEQSARRYSPTRVYDRTAPHGCELQHLFLPSPLFALGFHFLPLFFCFFPDLASRGGVCDGRRLFSRVQQDVCG